MFNTNQMKINKPKKKLTKDQISSIVFGSVLALAHIFVIAFVIFAYGYFNIYPALFYSVIAIIVCLLAILDIIFFVGLNHRDLFLKIVTCVISIFILIGSCVGTYFVNKVNGTVNNVLGNDDSYETYSGVFVSYTKYHTYSSLEDLSGKKLGMVHESSEGIGYIATSLLNEKNIDFATVDTYENTTELLTALIDGEIDAVVVSSAYRSLYENDDNSNIKDYLEELNDFEAFEKDIKVVSNKKKKDLTKEPFNVLLIGWSRTDIGSSVGLADAIIVATINPQTYTVSMMSIARDSFVPISCYGGSCDKINSGRSTSRSCFIETVENFLGLEIDYYMEADYQVIIYMVNSLGGVYIDNPVDFELDGVNVPAGQYIADGWQALEFMRERHHMPNGDFDRQKHQKEVIIEICKTMINAGDINVALNAMHNASPWLDTNFTLQELTTVFNLLLNTKNYTSLDTFDLVDFETLRITGNGGIMYYSYSLELPLWVYLIYQGSYDESMEHLYDIMGKYDSINQEYSFEFSANSPYVRDALYSESYPNEYMYQPEKMPPYWASLEGLTYAEALEWAASNNVTLTVEENILPGDDRYVTELDGTVYSQSIRYGRLISENSSGSIVVMGTGEIDESKQVPSFTEHHYSKFIEWADKYYWDYEIEFDSTLTGSEYSKYKVGDVVSQSEKVGTYISKLEKTFEVVVKASKYTIDFETQYGTKPEAIVYKTGNKSQDLPTLSKVTENSKIYVFAGWYTSGGTRVSNTSEITGENGSTVKLTAKWNELYTITLDANGGNCSASSVTTADSLPNASKAHYNFIGWFTEAEGGSQISDLSTLTSSTTLFAHYSPADWSEDLEVTACTSCTCETGEVLTGCTITGNGDTQNTCDCHCATQQEPVIETQN